MGKVAIFDDSMEDAEILEYELKKYLGNEKIYIRNFFDIQFILDNKIDLLFLDIEIGDVSGITEITNFILEHDYLINIIFISNHDTYFQESIAARPMYYIRKRHIEFDLKRTFEILERNNFSIRRVIEEEQIEINLIVYIESKNKFVTIHFENGNIIKKRDKLDFYENSLAYGSFIRCHKSYLVNAKYIKKKTKDIFIMYDGNTIGITRKYYNNATKKWQSYKIKVE